MTPEEQTALRISTERDVDQIVRACWPIHWSSEPAPDEPGLATGCIHPVRMLKLSSVNGHVYCALCNNVIEQELVTVRMDAFMQGKG